MSCHRVLCVFRSVLQVGDVDRLSRQRRVPVTQVPIGEWIGLLRGRVLEPPWTLLQSAVDGDRGIILQPEQVCRNPPRTGELPILNERVRVPACRSNSSG